MPAFKNLEGHVFSRLTVKKFLGKGSYLCACKCGTEKVVAGGHLKSGHTKSCGCLHDEGNNKKHGYTHTPIYLSYQDMRTRCLNPNNKQYPDYAGRGITICDRWLGEHGFEHFLRDMGDKPEGLTLDRIDNDGNYEPGNCRWATPTMQTINRRKATGTSSHYRGVHKCNGKFVARITINKVTRYLGVFTSEESAACAYNKASRKYHKQYGILNQIESIGVAA